MLWYSLGVSLHILAAFLWIGLVVYPLLVVEPVLKGVEGAEPRRHTPVLVARVGWPCLALTPSPLITEGYPPVLVSSKLRVTGTIV
jgi:hypothetical protein